MPRKAKRTVGRPPIPESDRATRINTTVGPAVRDYLASVGGGLSSRGARLVLIRAAELAKSGKNILREKP